MWKQRRSRAARPGPSWFLRDESGPLTEAGETRDGGLTTDQCQSELVSGATVRLFGGPDTVDARDLETLRPRTCSPTPVGPGKSLAIGMMLSSVSGRARDAASSSYIIAWQ